MANPTLSDAIGDIRREISKAQRSSSEGELKFFINEIELDLELVASAVNKVEGQAEVSGSIWSVLTAKAGGSASKSSGSEHTHRVKLKMSLAPSADGNPMPIHGAGTEPKN